MFDHELTQEDRAEIQTALALHPDPPTGPPGEAPPVPTPPSSPTPAAPPRLPGTPLPATLLQNCPTQLPVEAAGPPAPPTGDFSRCRGCPFWLERHIPTQRHVPASTLQIVDSVADSLLQALHDPHINQEQRRLYIAMALVMPRWLWPEPPRPEGRALAPRSRPRLVQTQAQHFLDRDLEWLLSAFQADHDSPEDLVAPPRRPGLLTESDARRLLQAGRQKRLTAAWKQLFSFGVAGACRHIEMLFLQKWLPAPLFPEEVPGHYATPGQAHDLLSEERIQQASRNLTRGSAIDALGWSHESWQTVQRLPHGGKLLRKLLVLYTTGQMGHEAEDLFNSSLIVPLHKNPEGTAIRPIAIPSIHRKVFARCTVALYKSDLHQAAGEHQHAAMQPDGATRMAKAIQAHLRNPDNHTVYLRTDIRNAFNEVNRAAALQALATAHPHLAGLQHAWLHRPTPALLRTTQGSRATHWTHEGIPQGDPISSLTFALVIAEPLCQVNHVAGCSAVAYADDCVLACSPEMALPCLDRWQTALQRQGLSLNMAKLEVWNPHSLALPGALQDTYPGAVFSTEGFRVCGLPVDQADGEDPLTGHQSAPGHFQGPSWTRHARPLRSACALCPPSWQQCSPIQKPYTLP